jgi:HlyD family secretion protein
MSHFRAFAPLHGLPCAIPCMLLATALCLATPAFADDEAPLGKGQAVTTIKATRTCFDNIVEISGFIIPSQRSPNDQAEKQVRPERFGLKVIDVLAEAGDTVAAGQTLARLSLPEGGTMVVQAPVAGLVTTSTATIGASATNNKGDPLFGIMARGDYDFAGAVSTEDLAKLANGQPASVKVIGAGDIDGTVRSIAPTVDRGGQLGQVFIAINNPNNRRLLLNASGRAQVKTSRSCGISVPLSAVQYGTAGTVVQVVKGDRIETQRVELGLTSGGQIEIHDGVAEGDDVVARAGALLREGDRVRPVTAAANATPSNR